MQNFVDNAVASLLSQHCGVVDEALVSYVGGCVAEDGDGEGLSSVDDFLAAVSPEWSNLPEGQRLSLLLELHAQVCAAAWQPNQLAASASQDTSSQATALDVGLPKVLQPLSLNSPQGRPSPAKQQQQQQQHSVAMQEACSAVQESDIDQLLELCPSCSSREFLVHVLELTGSLEAAVDWVLMAGEHLPAREAAWLHTHEADRSADAALHNPLHDKKLRQQVLARFDLQVVPSGPPSCPRKQQLSTWGGAHTKQPAKQVRYREGQPVTNKGEKYIVETTKEEWDGGSKGKVYTKGKRGKGFM